MVAMESKSSYLYGCLILPSNTSTSAASFDVVWHTSVFEFMCRHDQSALQEATSQIGAYPCCLWRLAMVVYSVVK